MATAMTDFTRPDASILGESTPLFFIGQNQMGFWVIQDSNRRAGGLFLSRESAISWTKQTATSGGCAWTFVNEGLELDLVAGTHVAGDRTAYPKRADYSAMTMLKMIASKALYALQGPAKIMSHLAAIMSEIRAQRTLIESELYRGRYRHRCKYDDDLPVVQ